MSRLCHTFHPIACALLCAGEREVLTSGSVTFDVAVPEEMGANTLEKLYYTLAGVLLCLLAVSSWLYLNKRSGKKKRSNNDNNDDEGEDKSCRFYMNVFVLNKQDVIKEKVKSKFGNFKYLGSAVAAVAGRVVTDERFTNALYEKMSCIIPERLREELGVESSVDLEYSIKSYFVISVDIKTADARVLVKKRGGEKHLKIYDRLISSLFGHIMQQSLSDQLVGIIGDKLVERLPEKLTERLKDGGGVDVEAVAKSEAEQARYFFTAVKLISKSNVCSPEIVGEVSTNEAFSNNNEVDTNMKYNDDDSDGVYVTNTDTVPDNTTLDEAKQSTMKEKKSGWYPGKFINKFTKGKK